MRLTVQLMIVYIKNKSIAVNAFTCKNDTELRYTGKRIRKIWRKQ